MTRMEIELVRDAGQAETSAVPWPVPDPAHRAAWRQRRQALEGGRKASTPEGEHWNVSGRALAATMRLADRIVRGARIHHVFAPSTRRLRLKEIELELARLPAGLEGYRILHLTDPHFDGVDGLGEALCQLLEGVAVDLCAITGDFRFAGKGRFVETSILGDIERLQEAVSARDGFVATLGNHDPHDLVPPLEAAGLRFLVNESVTVERAGASLRIAGTDDVFHFYTEAAHRALRPIPSDGRSFGLVLVHTPCLVEAAAQAGYGLYLAGHTHAGQICLPGGRPLITTLRRNRDYARGLWRHGALAGHTGPGIGASGVPIRLFCPGEATILTLRQSILP
jgi:uncharacterized protein